MIWNRACLTILSTGSSLLSFLGYTILIRKFGGQPSLDIVFISSSIPLAFGSVVSGLILYILPSKLAGLREDQQNRVLRFTLVSSIILFAFGESILLICEMFLRRWVFVTLLSIYFVNSILLVISSVLNSIFQARGKIVISGVASLINSMGVVIGAVVSAKVLEVWVFPIGQLVGLILSVVIMFLLSGSGISLKSNDFKLIKNDLYLAKKNALLIAVGTLAFTLFQVIDSYLCVSQDGGAVSAISYSQKIMVSVGTVISLGAYAVAAKTSYEQLRSGGAYALTKMANRETFRVVGFGIFCWLLFNWFGSEVITFMLSGAGIQESNVKLIINCLGLMLLGVGPMAAIPYLFRVYYANNNFVLPAKVGLIIPGIYGLIGWITVPLKGPFALGYAYIFVWWAALIFLCWDLNNNSYKNQDECTCRR